MHKMLFYNKFIICLYMVSTVLFCQVEGTVSDIVRACVRACVCARVCVYHKETNRSVFFYVLLTVHLSIFISVINQLDVQNFVLQ